MIFWSQRSTQPNIKDIIIDALGIECFQKLFVRSITLPVPYYISEMRKCMS